MKTSLFGHELRAALRESRLFLPIPALVTLLALALWHFVWMTHSASPLASDLLTMSQRDSQNLINEVWPWVAWLVPYAILKFPDLKIRDAFWRTTPMRVSYVFGTRLLIAFFVTVPLPAAACFIFLKNTLPEIAAAQTGVVALNQAFYCAVGVFAALVAPRHRGVLTVGVMLAIWMLTNRLASDLILALKPGGWSGYDVETPFLRFGIPALALPATVWLVWFTNRNLSLKTCAALAAGASASVVIVTAFAPKKPAPTLTTLPEISVAMAPVAPEILSTEAERRRIEDGYRRTDRTFVLGEGRVPMPGGFIPSIWSSDDGQSIDGSWSDGSQTEWLDGDLWSEKPRVALNAIVPRWTQRNGITVTERWDNRPNQDDDRLRLAARDLIDDPHLRIWCSAAGREKEHEWKPADELIAQDMLAFRFSAPNPAAFAGKNLALTGTVPGIAPGKVTLLFRGPAGKPGEYRTNTIALAWKAADMRGALPPNLGLGMDAKLAQRRPPFRALFVVAKPEEEFSQNLHALIYHPKLGQLVHLGFRVDRIPSNSPLRTAEMNGEIPYVGAEFFNGYIHTGASPFPMQSDKDYSGRSREQEAWIAGAELLIFSFENDKTVSLPMRATLAAPSSR